MAYSTAEGRSQILDDLAVAVDQLAVALACLNDAYELLDDTTAERLETELFGPVQKAYGRAKRTHAGFAERHALATRVFVPAAPGHPSQGAKAFIERAVAAAGQAGHAIGELQDTMLPHEVGDQPLRDGLAQVRQLLDGLPARSRELLRRLGR